MKLLRSLFVLLSPMILFFGCTKEKSFEAGNNNVNAQWEFKEGSNQFKGTVDTAFLVDLGASKGFVLEGTSDDGTGLLTIAISNFNTAAPATYKTPNVQFGYVKPSGILYQSNLAAIDQFTVQVTGIDSVSVTGVFSGKVKDSAGADKTVVDGKFTAKLKNSPTPAPNGQLTFWSKATCTAGGNIAVKLSNNQTGTITAFTANAPTCGANGTASFNVPAGNYVYQAICGTDTLNAVVSVVSNQCTTQELIFAGTAPTGQVTFWAKNSCTAGGNITIRINSQQGAISTFTATAPANCGAAGAASFTLPQGVYSYKALCGGDSLQGNVVITAAGCTKQEIVFPTGTGATYSLVSTAGNCANFTPQGTYTQGVALDNSNKVTVQVNVTVIGSYSITTNNVNGYSFSAAGNFTTTGVQNVVLQGVGTPTAAGTNNFTTTASTSNCAFPITVNPGTPTGHRWSFTQGRNFEGPVTDAFWDDDWLGFGKSVDIYGEIAGTDTIVNIYVQFPASATQPIPGTYVTNSDPTSNITHDFLMWDNNNTTTFIYWAKDITPPFDPNVKMTIIITSYDPTTKIIKGTFSGQCWNGAGQVVTISNGKFEAEVEF